MGSRARAPGKTVMVGLDIGGYEQRLDWPKLGPSLLIGAGLILAVRAPKWPVRGAGGTASDRDLDAIHLAGRVLSSLVSHHETVFPRKETPRFRPNGDDVPK